MKSPSFRYIFFTDNVVPMVEFYRDVLGMAVVGDVDPKEYKALGWVRLAQGDFEIGIHRAGGPGSKGLNRNKLALIKSDLVSERERVKAQGVKVGKLMGDESFQRFEFSDPDGNKIQFVSR
jgi:catechol 2,3-dioxygenase-like lactoylglutathione lyase family enzyme